MKENTSSTLNYFTFENEKEKEWEVIRRSKKMEEQSKKLERGRRNW